MTLPQVNVLSRYWISVPPAALQLKRISLALGLPDTTPKKAAATPQEAMREALAAGIPVMQGRPNDPMLALIGL